jgi:ABC-2 type transport system ATP-binding protein
MAIITVQNLKKRYGDIEAVKNISFEIEEREIFGIVGPNGAGKTTTIEIMEGFRTRDDGLVRVNGFDPAQGQNEFKEMIGVQLQKTAIFPNIKVEEALLFFAGLYRKKVEVKKLLDMFSLSDRKKSAVKNLSGGEHQRLSVALALVNDPRILFLDEPTTGLDPNARRDLWAIIEEGRRTGKTTVLTTHYMEEAEKLCHRVAIIDRGEIIALDKPRELIRRLEADKKIEFALGKKIDMDVLRRDEHIKKLEERDAEYTLFTAHPQPVLAHILSLCQEQGLELKGLRVIDATLDDVFVSLAGRKME